MSNDFDGQPKVSTARVVAWVAVGGAGLFFVISGLVGVLSGG